MAAKPEIRINPDVFKRAVAGSGWEAEELSQQTGIKIESIKKWESGEAVIGIAELQKISKTIKRPLSELLLPKPPNDEVLRDYRRIGGADGQKRLSKEALNAIRRARYVQSNAYVMLEMRSEDARPKITPRTLEDDPENAAELERETLGINLEGRQTGENMDEFVQNAYAAIKNRIESLNILVMQMGMDVAEVRGFALSEKHPNVIVVNSRDDPRPRLFTLLHEYAHLLLRLGGICPNGHGDVDGNPEQDVAAERWCNSFAGSVIMPKDAVLEELDGMTDNTPKQVVASLSRKFCSSSTAAAVRILNLLGDGPLREEYLRYYKGIPSRTTAGAGWGRGGRNMAKECIGRNGMRYVRLVLDSGAKGAITINDMIRYLDLNTRHFERLEELVWGYGSHMRS